LVGLTVVIQFAQDLSLRFEMTDYLACHIERIVRNPSSLYRDPFKLHHHPIDSFLVTRVGPGSAIKM
jgi:hypothetical protein